MLLSVCVVSRRCLVSRAREPIPSSHHRQARFIYKLYACACVVCVIANDYIFAGRCVVDDDDDSNDDGG